MNILIGLLLVLGFVLYLVIAGIKVRRMFQKDYTEIFNAENLPDLQDEALNELMKEGL